MKINRLIWIWVFPFLWLSCEDNTLIVNETTGNNAEMVIGNWIRPQYDDSTVTYVRSDGLKDNEYGFSFKRDSVFIERKNAGWCGTPPVSYDDFEGTWSIEDSVLKITVAYWGGFLDYKWKIMSLDQHHLTVYTIALEYHPDME